MHRVAPSSGLITDVFMLVPQVTPSSGIIIGGKHNPDAIVIPAPSGVKFMCLSVTLSSLAVTPKANRFHTKSMLRCRQIKDQSNSLHSVTLPCTISGNSRKFRESWQVGPM